MHEIVAYTFLNIDEKIHQFLLSITRDARKRKLVPFFLPHGVYEVQIHYAVSGVKRIG